MRLPLTRAVLERCRADLSDLRVLAETGPLSTYLRRQAVTAVEETYVTAKVRAAERNVDGASSDPAAMQSERYLLSAPPWTDDGTWRLDVLVGPMRNSFARDLELIWSESAGDPPDWTGSLFRLRDGREVYSFPLPTRRGDTLQVRLRGQDRGAQLEPLEPTFVFVRERKLERNPPTLEIELELQPSSDPAFDHLAALPAGFFADALRFETSTGTYRRRVTIAERAADGEIHALSRGWIQSLEGATGEQNVRLPPGRPIRGGLPSDGQIELLLEIDGGDSPHLDELRVFATLPQPELVFEWPEGAQELELLFGGGRVRAPRFDLDQAAGRRWFPNEPDELTWSLLGDAVLPAARLGNVESNPDFSAAPLLAAFQRAGAAIDETAYSLTAAVALPDDETGLYRIPLPPDLLARVREDYADLRFIADRGGPDATGASAANQWPYLVDEGPDWTLDLEIEPVRDANGTSEVRLNLPYDLASEPGRALRPSRLHLTFGQPFFDREVRIDAVGRGETRRLLERRVTTSSPMDALLAPNRATSSAVIPLGGLDSQPFVGLVLEIVDGDDAPAIITSAELRGSGRQALLVAPSGSYRALFSSTGRDRPSAPAYEIQRAAELVTSLRGARVNLGAIEENPAQRSPGLLSRLRGGWESLALWAAILLAVLALGWITLRSVRP